MLEVMMAIKNNNMRKIPNYDQTPMEHLRKLLRQYTTGKVIVFERVVGHLNLVRF